MNSKQLKSRKEKKLNRAEMQAVTTTVSIRLNTQLAKCRLANMSELALILLHTSRSSQTELTINT